MSIGSSGVQGARLTAVVIALAIALTGCGSAKRATSATSTSTTTTTLSNADAAILDSYRDFEADFLAAGATMNPDDPRLAAHATGTELQQVRQSFAGLKVDGDVIEGTIAVHPTLVSSKSDTATIRDCSVDAGKTVKAATGAVVGDGSVQNELDLVTMSYVDGAWKVASIKHEGTGCTPGA